MSMKLWVIESPAGEGQGEGEGGLQLPGTRRFAWHVALFSFAGSSRLHRQFANALVCGSFLPPHPRCLSPRRGRTEHGAFANPERLDSSQRGMQCSLSLRAFYYPQTIFDVCTCTSTGCVFYRWMLQLVASARSTPSAPDQWAVHEFGRCQMSDQRLTKRLASPTWRIGPTVQLFSRRNGLIF